MSTDDSPEDISEQHGPGSEPINPDQIDFGDGVGVGSDRVRAAGWHQLTQLMMTVFLGPEHVTAAVNAANLKTVQRVQLRGSTDG